MCQSNEDSPECHSGKGRLQTLSPGGDRSDTPAAVRPVMRFSVSWSTETIFGVAQIISVGSYCDTLLPVRNLWQDHGQPSVVEVKGTRRKQKETGPRLICGTIIIISYRLK